MPSRCGAQSTGMRQCKDGGAYCKVAEHLPRLVIATHRAASSSAKSICSRMGSSSRTTKGMVTKRVASAMPAGRGKERCGSLALRLATAASEVQRTAGMAGQRRIQSGWAVAAGHGSMHAHEGP